jgi:hypothetical protein
MSSTAFAASIFPSRLALYDTVLEASKFGALGVRASLLSLTGSLKVSYAKSRLCVCGTKFTCEHFLSCSLLGRNVTCLLKLAVEQKDWRGAAIVLLSRFEVYLHAIRGGELRNDECDLFSALNEVMVADEFPGSIIEC